MTDQELEMLRELADARGLSAADIVRQLVREEHKREFPPGTSTIAPKKKR